MAYISVCLEKSKVLEETLNYIDNQKANFQTTSSDFSIILLTSLPEKSYHLECKSNWPDIRRK